MVFLLRDRKTGCYGVSRPEGPKAGPKGRKWPEGPPTRSRAHRAHRLLVVDSFSQSPCIIPRSHLVSEKELRGSRGDLVVVIGQVNVSLLFHECIGELQLECGTETSALQ